MERKIWICLEKAPNNYSAYAPEVPGCISTGPTIEETKANMMEALSYHLEGMVEDGESLDGIRGDFPIKEAMEGGEDEYYALVEIVVAPEKVGV